MPLDLSTAELQQIESAQQTLLAPFDYADAATWRLAVNRELRSLLGADSAGFLLPGGEGPPMLSEEHDVAALNRFPELLPPDLSDGTPIWVRHLELGVCTIGSAYGRDVGIYHRSDYYQQYARPNGAGDTLGMSISLGGLGPAGAASVHLWRERRSSFRQRHIGILRLLFPAFRSGVDMHLRFRAQRTRLLQTLDELGQAVLVADRSGRALLETAALRAALAADPERIELRAALTLVAHAVQHSWNATPGPVTREVRTRLARYAVHGCRYHGVGDDEPVTVVALARLSPRRRTAEELQREFALTRSEAHVAMLLSEGRSNADIAAALGISPHTARRHTERVLLKLDVRSRAEVAGRVFF